MTNEEFQNLVLEKLSGLDSKIGGLDSKMSSLESRMDRQEARMDGLEAKMDAGFQQLDSLISLSGKDVDRIPLIEAKINLLNNRLLENEANIQILKAAK